MIDYFVFTPFRFYFCFVHARCPSRWIYSGMDQRWHEFRSFAFICEAEARDAIDPLVKREWYDAAIEWRRMADAVKMECSQGPSDCIASKE